MAKKRNMNGQPPLSSCFLQSKKRFFAKPQLFQAAQQTIAHRGYINLLLWKGSNLDLILFLGKIDNQIGD
jgi:hypothetical protein